MMYDRDSNSVDFLSQLNTGGMEHGSVTFNCDFISDAHLCQMDVFLGFLLFFLLSPLARFKPFNKYAIMKELYGDDQAAVFPDEFGQFHAFVKCA